MFVRLDLVFVVSLYVLAGTLHFLKPRYYLRIMPPYLPWPKTLVYLSGVAEVALGVGLLIPAYSACAAGGVFALLIVVFTANIYMYEQGSAVYRLPHWALLLRLPLQFVLMAWAYAYT